MAAELSAAPPVWVLLADRIKFCRHKKIYRQAGGHRDISILEDYDLSLRLADAGARCTYDRRTAVFTSARRMKGGIIGYTAIYLTGFYHYHITKSDDRLLKYPHPRTIALQRSAISGDLRQARQKISSAWGEIHPGRTPPAGIDPPDT
ncbi:hypothetical protein [Methanogenium cariaci]|uniref:hypothetical protein n=1 Tax=Methanogenium cariaci TaxID=2197 RepID=UPI0012F671F3|nr:hypothetical protein [Methanogenium cariaci]